MRRLTILLMAILAGCNANSGEQAVARLDAQATAEIAATVEARVEGKIEADLARVDARLDDHSTRITEATQKAVLAVNKVDNSSSDKVVNRVMAIGMITELILLVLLAFYPELGRMVKFVGGRLRRGTSHHTHAGDQGTLL